MEQTLNKTELSSKAIAREFAIAISFAVIYFILVKINPFATLTGVTSLAILGNIRIAEMLKAFAIVSPSALGGIAMGAYAFNVYSGRVALGAYSAMPIIIMGVGLFIYTISRFIGRSTKKDLLMLACYGLITGIIVSLNLVAVSVIFNSETWVQLINIDVLRKISFNIAMPMIGYPLVKLFEKSK